MGGALVPGDPFYKTGTWARLKAVVRRRSGGVCEVLECSAPAVVCDHIVARRAGGADHESNLRDLCRQHDGQVKEMADGSRPFPVDVWPVEKLKPYERNARVHGKDQTASCVPRSASSARSGRSSSRGRHDHRRPWPARRAKAENFKEFRMILATGWSDDPVPRLERRCADVQYGRVGPARDWLTQVRR
jgi:hypothetical protein